MDFYEGTLSGGMEADSDLESDTNLTGNSQYVTSPRGRSKCRQSTPVLPSVSMETQDETIVSVSAEVRKCAGKPDLEWQSMQEEIGDECQLGKIVVGASYCLVETPWWKKWRSWTGVSARPHDSLNQGFVQACSAC